MITILSLQEIESQFATNEHRRALYDLLVSQIEQTQRQYDNLSVLLFGSFITKKEIPEDIDLIVSYACSEERYSGPPARVAGKQVDLHRYRLDTLSAAAALRRFNGEPRNVEKGIAVPPEEVIAVKLN